VEYYLEHANVTAPDVAEAIKFLQAALPDFRVRGTSQGQKPDEPVRWVHLGTDTFYICLNPVSPESTAPDRQWGDAGINHVGFAVDDTEAVRVRLESAGYEAVYSDPAHPHRRRLYAKGGGVDWEFVEYLSEDPAERNDYRLPG